MMLFFCDPVNNLRKRLRNLRRGDLQLRRRSRRLLLRCRHRRRCRRRRSLRCRARWPVKRQAAPTRQRRRKYTCLNLCVNIVPYYNKLFFFVLCWVLFYFFLKPSKRLQDDLTVDDCDNSEIEVLSTAKRTRPQQQQSSQATTTTVTTTTTTTTKLMASVATKSSPKKSPLALSSTPKRGRGRPAVQRPQQSQQQKQKQQKHGVLGSSKRSRQGSLDSYVTTTTPAKRARDERDRDFDS